MQTDYILYKKWLKLLEQLKCGAFKVNGSRNHLFLIVTYIKLLKREKKKCIKPIHTECTQTILPVQIKCNPQNKHLWAHFARKWQTVLFYKVHTHFINLFFFSVAGCPVAIKRVGSSKRISLAAEAMMAMDCDVTQGPSVSSAHPLHLLLPIKLPFLMAPQAGRRTAQNAFISVLALMEKKSPADPYQCYCCPKGPYSCRFGGVTNLK